MTLARAGRAVRVMIVDDGSTEPPDALQEMARGGGAIRAVEVVVLRRNVGHQRAIALGLCRLSADADDTAPVVVMDADGQDRVEDVARLLDEFDHRCGKSAVFAERARRPESPTFRALYRLYRALHFVLIGRPMRIGNFSVLPREYVHRLVIAPELWCHYAAAVVRTRLPMALVPADRNNRLDGQSQMT